MIFPLSMWGGAPWQFLRPHGQQEVHKRGDRQPQLLWATVTLALACHHLRIGLDHRGDNKGRILEI